MNMGNNNISGASSSAGAPHCLILSERKQLSLTGVDDVMNFDDKTVEISTELGMMTVEGDEIHIEKLDILKKELVLCGKISAIFYTDKTVKKSRGLFGKEKSGK